MSAGCGEVRIRVRPVCSRPVQALLVGPACSVDFGTRVASQYGETARQQRDSAPAGGVLLQ